ncbi:hypothetical protein Y032_0055g2543 [Ancylostoma ceylanicum]|uniref:tRNA synthetases class I (E and Q) anti-codon binding domain-containing protein n=1 Tax=Ancylostoma ceylanicum TaxID=53326 RepID=A0A016U522_9BILA|nr:hypothetical protein Y032_0055g2543 [Ancylostoma ceylanicum]
MGRSRTRKKSIGPVSDCVHCAKKQRRFKSKNPEDPNEVPGGFLTDVNKDSLTVLYTVLIDKSIAHSKVYDRYQFERVGYFSVDPDTVPGKKCPEIFGISLLDGSCDLGSGALYLEVAVSPSPAIVLTDVSELTSPPIFEENQHLFAFLYHFRNS